MRPKHEKKIRRDVNRNNETDRRICVALLGAGMFLVVGGFAFAGMCDTVCQMMLRQYQPGFGSDQQIVTAGLMGAGTFCVAMGAYIRGGRK